MTDLQHTDRAAASSTASLLDEESDLFGLDATMADDGGDGEDGEDGADDDYDEVDPDDVIEHGVTDELSDLFRFADVVDAATRLQVVGRPLPIHPTRGTPAQVLIIDADDASRLRQREQLEAVGYQVLAAGTAARGLDLARSRHVDVVLVDARLADLDGWGVLCALRAAAAVSEVRVVLMSSDADVLQELACASIGADSYFQKGAGLPEAIVGVVDKVLARRFGVLAQLTQGAWGPLSDVGVQALLDGICGSGLRGRLEVDDGVMSWEVDVDGGVIAQVRCKSSNDPDDWTQPIDRPALLGLLNVRDAPWSFELLAAPPTRTLGLPWSRLARELCAEIDDRRARLRAHLLSQPRPVALDAARLSVWLGRANDAAADVVRALQDGATPQELVADPRWSPLLVDEVLQELVDRNIVLLLPEPTAPRVRWTPATVVRPPMQARVASRRALKGERSIRMADRGL